MSTQPIARRRMRRVARRPDLRRTLSIGIAFALTFILAYAIGHSKGCAAVREHLAPNPPSVTAAVPVTLGTAPPIEIGVLRPPPPRRATRSRHGAADCRDDARDEYAGRDQPCARSESTRGTRSDHEHTAKPVALALVADFLGSLPGGSGGGTSFESSG